MVFRDCTRQEAMYILKTVHGIIFAYLSNEVDKYGEKGRGGMRLEAICKYSRE